MDKTKIKPIKIRGAFYNILKDNTIAFVKELSLLSDEDMKDKGRNKWDVVDFIDKLYQDETKPEIQELIHDKLKLEYPSFCGISPKPTEEILNCTTTERKRWTDDKLIPVVGYVNAGTKRKPIEVAMFNRDTIENLTDEILEVWRANHKIELSESRKTHEKVKLISKNLTVVMFCEGQQEYVLFSPTMINENDIDSFWEEYKYNKDTVPYKFRDKKFVVILQEHNTKEVLRIYIHDVKNEVNNEI